MKITGVLLKDNKNDTVTAYIKQFPEVVVEGDSIDDAKERLQNTFDKFLDYTYRNKNYEIDYNEYKLYQRAPFQTSPVYARRVKMNREVEKEFKKKLDDLISNERSQWFKKAKRRKRWAWLSKLTLRPRIKYYRLKRKIKQRKL